MSTLQVITLLTISLLLVFLLLLAGAYYNLTVTKHKIDQLFKQVLYYLQYYCDNLRYTIEAYRILNPNDQARVQLLIGLKAECLESKTNLKVLNIKFNQLHQALNELFALRHNDDKIAHDLRFIEAFTEFESIYQDFSKAIAKYNDMCVFYNKHLEKNLGLLLKNFFKLQ